MVTHEKTINQCLLHEIDKHQNTIVSLNKQIDEWRTKHKEVEIKKTDIENSHAVLKREYEKSEKEAVKLREEKLALMQDILELKKEVGEYQKKNASMLEEIEFMKQKEFERIQQLDLDDIDLISEFSKLGIREKSKQTNMSKINPLVPKLDLTKVFEWRESQDKIEKKNAIKQHVKEDLDENIELSIRDEYVGTNLDAENYEEPSSIADTFKEYYPQGITIDSSKTISVIRKEKLF